MIAVFDCYLNATSTYVCSFVPFQPAAILDNPPNGAERRSEGFGISKGYGVNY